MKGGLRVCCFGASFDFAQDEPLEGIRGQQRRGEHDCQPAWPSERQRRNSTRIKKEHNFSQVTCTVWRMRLGVFYIRAVGAVRDEWLELRETEDPRKIRHLCACALYLHFGLSSGILRDNPPLLSFGVLYD
jgi:hypothetical protein